MRAWHTNGSISLWFDGVLQETQSGIDNPSTPLRAGSLRVEQARLGATGSMEAGIAGTEYFDAFESRRQTYIGPAGVFADFSASPVQGAAPLTVTFTNASQPTATITSYLWNFGDGYTSTITNPVHTYTTNGTFTVALTASDGVAQDTLTKTHYITVSDFLFADGFESGNFAAWSAEEDGEGDLNVTAAAALVGTQGMAALIDNTTAMYVRDDTPASEPRYRARFYFDPNSVTIASGNSHDIFAGRTSSTVAFVVRLFFSSGGTYRVYANIRDDAGSYTGTASYAISDAPHFIEIDWAAATASGANNGYVSLWIDGVLQETVSGIDNDTLHIEEARLGPLEGIDTGTSGTEYFDAFESRRQTYIGPVGGGGSLTTTVITYTYDPLYRLTEANYSGAYTYTFAYAYDTVGNRTAFTRTITSTLVTTYTYDAVNRLATQNGQSIFTWDANGNLLQDGSTVYAYDFANRLISTTLGGVNTQFGYNGDGIRLRLIEAGTLTTYTQDYAAPLPVVLQAKTGTASTQYVYSLGTRPLAEYEAAAWEYLLADPLGSVRQIADPSGNVTLLKSYEPYGSVLNSQGSAASIFAYAGEQVDAYAGLVYLRARYMQPKLGVFLSRDPWLGYEQMPGTYNGFNYASDNPVNLTDPAGLQSLPGVAWFARCFDLHTATPLLNSSIFDPLGIPIQDSTTAKRAVEICRAAYSAANWDPHIPVLGFQLGQDLPTRAHDLFGWFVHDWRGGYNSDRLYFDANQPLTEEVLRTIAVGRIRNEYYAGYSNVGGPTEYQFDAWQYFLAGLEITERLSEGTLNIAEFMGSFWYQIKTLPNDRIGFRIDNDTTLASGSHIAERYEPQAYQYVEILIKEQPSLENKPLQELIRENPSLISILRKRTRGETGGQGGGNLYQTFYWTEKRACTWAEVWFGDHAADMQVWEWGDFKSRTVDPPGFPPN